MSGVVTLEKRVVVMATSTDKIIEGLENFYHVWVMGARGDVIDVQKKLCDYHLISRQTAKGLIREPCVIHEGNLESARSEMEQLEALGVVCKIEHIGPDWLDSYPESKIVEKLKSFNGGSLKGIYIKQYSTGTYDIYCDGSPDPIYERYSGNEDETDEEFGLYLACTRYLAKHGRVKI